MSSNDFDRPTWALLNTRTNKLLAPLRIYGTWYRGLYDSEQGAKLAASKITEVVKYLDDKTLPKDELNEYYGYDVEALQGTYVAIRLKGGEIYAK